MPIGFIVNKYTCPECKLVTINDQFLPEITVHCHKCGKDTKQVLGTKLSNISPSDGARPHQNVLPPKPATVTTSTDTKPTITKK